MSTTTPSSPTAPASPTNAQPAASSPLPPPRTADDDIDSGTTTQAPEPEQHAVFRLLDLPDELKLHVVHLVDERDPSPTFPSGPSSELLNLSATSRFFHSVCKPLVWRSVNFVPDSVLRPRAYRKKRDMRALEALLRTRADQQQALPVVALSVSDLSADNDELFDLNDEDELPKEEAALARIIERLAESSLQVLFLKGMELHRDLGDTILRAIAASPRMSALRCNQVDFYPDEPRCVRDFGSLDHIRTLQIMHSDPEIVRPLPLPRPSCSHADAPRLARSQSSSPSAPTSTRSSCGRRSAASAATCPPSRSSCRICATSRSTRSTRRVRSGSSPTRSSCVPSLPRPSSTTCSVSS